MSDTDDAGGHPLVARLYDPVMALPERFVLSSQREFLTEGLDGSVLDLGAGTGVLFPYFDDLETSPDVTAVEPDPHMRAQARELANDTSMPIEIHDASGEALPFEDDTFDAVCASFVFCTIPDHKAALSEVARVLRPGGEFRFLEHVRGDDVVGLGHDLVAPCWHVVAGGCHLTRETDRLFLSDGRFRTREFERTDGLTGRLLPVVRGRLERTSESRLARTLSAFQRN